MLRRLIVVLIVALAAPVFAQAAKTGPGTTVVKTANDTIAGLLKQKVTPGSADEKALATKVTTSVRNFLDIDELGKRAMVDNWSKLTAGEKAQINKEQNRASRNIHNQKHNPRTQPGTKK